MELNEQSEPYFLDGSDLSRGQGQEGNDAPYAKMRVEFYEFLRQHIGSNYLCYPGYSLTDEDLLDLWTSDKQVDFMTPKARVEYYDRMASIMEKIDQDRTIAFQEHRLKQLRLNKSQHAGHELGAREFTLTYSPKWFNDEEARDAMKKAISKLVKYYSDEIIQLRAVGEVGSNGLSHIHCFYKLRGGLKISDKNFKRAYKYWNPKVKTSATGHQGGHHRTVKVESDFLGYIDKDVDTAWFDFYYPEVDPVALNS